MKQPKSRTETVVLAGIVAILFIPALVAVVVATIWRAVSWIRGNHEKAAENARDFANRARVSSIIAKFWSWLVAPTGMAKVATAIGITSPALITLATPVVVAVASAALIVAETLKLYSKWRKRRA